jgi:hypothetical protein
VASPGSAAAAGGTGTGGTGGTGATGTGGTAGGDLAATTIGNPLLDGAAVRRALALVQQRVGRPLRLTMLTVAYAGRYSLVVADVRRPGDPLAIDRYDVTLDGELLGPQDGSIQQLIEPGQHQVTAAGADAHSFTQARLPLAAWHQITANVIRRAGIRDGTVSSWAAYVHDHKLQIYCQVSSRYGGANAVLDADGRIVSMS